MISTVTVTRTMSAPVLVEHPDEWTAEQVTAALMARALDFGSRVQMWDAECKTTLGDIALDEDLTEDEEGSMPSSMDPFELVDADLGGE